MSYAFIQDVPIDETMYRKIRERMGDAPLEGLLCHLVVRRPDGKLRFIDVWESEEHSERAFAERIGPAVGATFAEAGLQPDAEPTREVLDLIEYELGARS